MSLESELFAWLHDRLPPDPKLTVGLGDDGAVLPRSHGADTVITTDMLNDGVDFLLAEVEPQVVGHKALAVNLSDLAAMAARPVSAFVSLVLPRGGSPPQSPLELAIGLYTGMLPLAARFNISIAGGDTNSWDGPLALSLTAVGHTTEGGPLTRCGAQAGDQLLVTGRLGGSILGRHLQVEPRIEEALLLNERYSLHAGIDISDGLALDASRLVQASGVGAFIDTSQVPLAPAAEQLSQRDGRSAVEHALSDGEDFELLLAVPARVAEQILADQPLQVPVTRIGEIVADPGLWQVGSGAVPIPLEPCGYEHQGDKS
ncbi:MAG: thiamine-phosphate kinase [Pirellulales bacterium]|nr:thiamine-phosphate kinase [Pirellulales bacterium]